MAKKNGKFCSWLYCHFPAAELGPLNCKRDRKIRSIASLCSRQLPRALRIRYCSKERHRGTGGACARALGLRTALQAAPCYYSLPFSLCIVLASGITFYTHQHTRHSLRRFILRSHHKLLWSFSISK